MDSYERILIHTTTTTTTNRISLISVPSYKFHFFIINQICRINKDYELILKNKFSLFNSVSTKSSLLMQSVNGSEKRNLIFS